MDTLTVQTLLQDAGFSPGPLDGIPGPLTKDAIKRFQVAYGLVVTGVPDSATQEVLQKRVPVHLGVSPASMLTLFNSAVINPKDHASADACASAIKGNWSRYAIVAAQFIPMPVYVIGAIHSLEANFNFKTHLANGDPLSIKTIHVPVGLGPFSSWEEGAVAAFKHVGWGPGMKWDMGNCLMHLRAYNGTGYESAHGINTPYLWSMTNHYYNGRYVSDGKFSPNSISQQVGAVAAMLALQSLGFKL